MLADKELISQLRKLRQIEPRKDWVSCTRKEILGEEPGFYFFPYLKPAFAGLIAVFVLVGLFGIVKNSLPGDGLYTIRKVAHKVEAIFVPEDEKPAFQLKLANDRLEDLTKVSAKNLAPTIYEFQANIYKAAENLAKIDATTSDPMVTQKIVEETIKLKENEKKVQSLGMIVEGDETNNFDKTVVEYLINDLENRSLTEEKAEILEQMKELFQEEKYSEALELYLINQ
jgi:hypothetical protein